MNPLNFYLGISLGAVFIVLGWWLASRNRRKPKGPPRGFKETEPPF